MVKTVQILVYVTVSDEVDSTQVGESLFDTLCQYADEDLISSVDGWDPARRLR